MDNHDLLPSAQTAEPDLNAVFSARPGWILFGGDYNPEQWTPAQGYDGETVWREDLRLMQLAGVNTVSLGVFSWVTLQPDEHTYEFGWLDRIMDLLAEHGIRVALATATAAQPAWLSTSFPDVLPVDEQDQRRAHGGRQNYCPTSPDFRRLGQDLVRRLAERYGTHPALLLWHVSNEYGPYCYCTRCAAHFRAWLRRRYRDLEELNRRWVTAFWSHTYTAWEQIEPPTVRGEQSMQGLLLDYRRFMSDMLLECYRGEVAVLKAITPKVPVTTNLMGAYKPLDYFDWAPQLDIISWDSYPQPHEHPAAVAFRHDLMRGLRAGQSWLLLEQTPSQVQWAPHNPLKRPGVLRLQSYQALARGADAVMFFQWRQSRGAFEKYHGAIVAHAGHEHTRVFAEVAALGAELNRLGDRLLGSRTPARVALLFSWPNWWNVEFKPGPSSSLDYLDEVQRYYRVLWERNVAVDVIPPGRSLAGYDLVIAPLLNMVTADQGMAIERYVEEGGTFLTTYFSGVVSDDDRAWLGGYPGPLRRVLGIWVEEFDPLLPGTTNRVVVPEGGPLPGGMYSCDSWCDLLHLESATALAWYGEDFYAGRPAICENRCGLGRGIYVATRPEPALLTALIGRVLDDASIQPPLEAPAGVEVTCREGQGGRSVFVLNHTDDAVSVPLPVPALDLLTERPLDTVLKLAAHDVAILI